MTSKNLPVSVSIQDRYMREVGKYKLLTREEELKLAVEYYETQDLEAAQKLVTANLRLVIKIANGYVRSGIRILDLIQEGNIGLMKAVKDFNPYKGVHYASWWIKAYIQNYLLKNWSLVKIGTTQAQRKLFYKLDQERRHLEALGITPGTKLLATNLGVKEHEVLEMGQRLSGKDVSLDVPVGESGTSSLIDFYATDATPVVELLEQEEMRRVVLDNLDEFKTTLNEKELQIFDRRIFTEEPVTLQEIGDQYGITRERVRQVEKKILDKLRQFIQTKAPELMMVEEE